MRNRAKCKKCSSILESFHEFDYVECKCGAVGITGGNVIYRVLAYDFKDVLRIDDNDKEIPLTFKEKDEDNRNPGSVNENINIVAFSSIVDGDGRNQQSSLLDDRKNTTREDLIQELGFMIENIESLPQHVMTQPVNHYDLLSFMLVVKAFLQTN